ncbi:hypothetical protein KIPB_008871, partial [Kipferlia bialata]
GVGLFATASYFNHSCYPSCFATWHYATGADDATTLWVLAARDIKIGDELTIYYISNPCMTRQQRRAMLWENYCFECNCEVCSLSGYAQIESDTSRARMQELREKRPANIPSLHKSGLADVLERLRLIVVELDAYPRAMGPACAEAFHLACCLGKGELARRMAYNSLFTELATSSAQRSKYHRDMEQFVQNPSKSHYTKKYNLKLAPMDPVPPVLESVQDGAWASIAKDLDVPAVWGIRNFAKESERDRRERLRLEAEAKKAEAAAASKEKMLKRRRLKMQKKKKHAAKKDKE